MNYKLNKIYSDYASVHAICREVLDVSDKEGIDAVLIGGSLLGMVRDNDFLPWDKDLDYAIFERDIAQTLALEPRYRELGYECRVHHLGVRPESQLKEGERLLSDISSALEQISIEHCLIGGALLNLYRDKSLFREIDTIGMVINVTATELTSVFSALTKFGQVYINQYEGLTKSLTLVSSNWRINFFVYVEEQSRAGWLDLNCEHWFDKPLFPVEKMQLASLSYYAPANAEQFIEARFGVNWHQQPKAKFSEGRVVGSVQLYKDGVMFDFIMHYVRGDKTYWYEPAANVISTLGFIPYSIQDTTAGKMLIPDNPEIFLQEHYGDWQTPVKTWDGAVDNPTIIDSDVAMQIILKSTLNGQ